jgi:hypothetical protein
VFVLRLTNYMRMYANQHFPPEFGVDFQIEEIKASSILCTFLLDPGQILVLQHLVRRKRRRLQLPWLRCCRPF